MNPGERTMYCKKWRSSPCDLNLVLFVCFLIPYITSGSPSLYFFRMSGMAGLFSISGKIWVSKYALYYYSGRGFFFKSETVASK